MANQLPSGRWRGRVRDPRTGKQVAPHTVIGGPTTYATQREAERAEDDARDVLLRPRRARQHRGRVVDRRGRPTRCGRARAESTNLHNRRAHDARSPSTYGDRPLRAIDAAVVAEWLKGGRNLGTVPALRAMFNDARRPHAGHADRPQPVRRARAQAHARAASTSSRRRPARSRG